MKWEILSSLVQWKIVLNFTPISEEVNLNIWSQNYFFKEISTCQLAHCLAIFAFFVFNSVQKSQSNNDRCC